MIRGAAAAIVALLLVAAGAAPAAPPPGAAAPQRRASLAEIEAEVMCPVCGTLLELADSPQARREKAFITRLIAEGKSEAQIKGILVAQYGPNVLALPEGSGFDLSAYLVPAIAFAVAAAGLAFAVVRWRRAAAPGRRRTPPRGPPEEQSERLDADMSRYDL